MMDDARAGLKALFDALVASPAATYTTYLGPRLAPKAATGKTSGRFLFILDAEATYSAEGAGDSRPTFEGVVALRLVAPMPASTAETDTSDTIVTEPIAQLWASLLAQTPRRAFTAGGHRFRATEYTVTRMIDRSLPWAAGLEHYHALAQVSVLYEGEA